MPNRKAGVNRALRYDFPYVQFHNRYYPLIPLTLRKGRYSVNTFALLDSGASISVFRPEIAKELNIPLRDRKAARLGTANGGVNIGIARVEIKIESTVFSTGIGFSDTYAASFNILGREGFFSRFAICFNESRRLTSLIPLEKQRRPSREKKK